MAKIAFILLTHKDPKGLIAQARRLTDTGDYVSIHFDARASDEDFALIYAALRDRVIQGTTPSLSPLTLPRLSVPSAIRAAELMRHYMHNLELRVFGNRPLNQVAVFYSFFFRFMQIWAERH